MVLPTILRETYSICPVCYRRIEAQLVTGGAEETMSMFDGSKEAQASPDGVAAGEQAAACGTAAWDAVYLQKECPEHGRFSTVVWRNHTDMSAWRGNLPVVGQGENLNCPGACGICADHRQNTCCVVLEVTARCNLKCSFCFADGGVQEKEPDLAQISQHLCDIAKLGGMLVQLSGGEPTVRDDLPQIVAAAKKAGCQYVQLNSNGIRLAEEPDFVRALAEAGLSFVFMQFDGTDDAIYQKLRGRDLVNIKERAIENCAACNLGVTLVPTLVPGVNTQAIGDIMRFAAAHSPAVRGVHFQPVSYFGRIPHAPRDEDRFTLDELIFELEQQAGELVRLDSILPSRCDHPLCGFHGDYLVLPDGTLYALTHKKEEEEQARTCATVSAEKNRQFVARRWQRPPVADNGELRTTGSAPGADGVSAPDSCCDVSDPDGCCDVSAPDNCCDASAPDNCCCCDVSAPDNCCDASVPDGCCDVSVSDGCCDASAPDNCCCCDHESHVYHAEKHESDVDINTLDGFLERVRSHGFTITAMAFQDAWNIDLERLRQCSLHVYQEGRYIPFCAYYLNRGAKNEL